MTGKGFFSGKDRDIKLIACAVILSLIIMFGAGLMPFSIAGNQTTYVNQPYSATIALTSPIAPQSDYTTGTVTKLFAGTAIYNSSGTQVFVSPQIELTSANYNYVLNHTFTTAGDYVIVGLLGETHSTYNYSTGAWSAWSPLSQQAHEEFKVTVKQIASAPTTPTFDLFGSLYAALKGFLAAFGINI